MKVNPACWGGKETALQMLWVPARLHLKKGDNQHFRSCIPRSVSLRNIPTGAGGFLAVTVTYVMVCNKSV